MTPFTPVAGMRALRTAVLGAILIGAVGTQAAAQTTKPAPPPTPAPKPTPAPASRPQPTVPRETLGVRGVGSLGAINFNARESFDAVLGSRTGLIFGGGGQVTIPGGLYVEAMAWRFSDRGERVFVGPNDEVFPLGIATRVTITPFELTGGWRFRNVSRRFVPHAGAGMSFYRYQETADFAGTDDDVHDRFTGFHVLGGMEYRAHRWIGVLGEVGWSSVPDALGAAGASAAFGEDDLGGAIFRLKIAVGR